MNYINVDQTVLDFLEENMKSAKKLRDKARSEKKEDYIFYQGALDEARKIYFELFVKHMEANHLKIKHYLVT
jgi:hypothetical protein